MDRTRRDPAFVARRGRHRYRNHRARSAQGAADRACGVRLLAGSWCRRRVPSVARPADEAIPALSTRIHGIDDAKVAARRFRRCRPQLRSVSRPGRGDRAHVGFDLAMLKQECDLAGLPWIRPRTLDTRLLAQIAAPDCRLFAGEARGLARRRRRRPAFRARRRGHDRAGVSGAGAEAARPRHPHLCGSRTGLPPSPTCSTGKSGPAG